MEKLKQYIRGLFFNVVVFSLVDIVFAALFTSVLVGVFYISTLILGDWLSFGVDELVLSAQILFLIYLLVIFYTSIGHLIRYKNNLSVPPVSSDQGK